MKRPLAASIVFYLICLWISINCEKALSIKCLLVLLPAAIILLLCTVKTRSHKTAFLSLAAVFGVIAFALSVFIHIPKKEEAEKLDGYSGRITAQITSLEKYDAYSKVTVKTTAVGEKNIRVKIYLSSPKFDDTYNVGDYIYIDGEINTDFTSSLTYDSEKIFASKKIFLLMRADNIEHSDISPNVFTRFISACRREISDDFSGFDNTGLMSGLLLGNKNEISDNITENFRKLGLSHALAVSGMHLSILVMNLYMFLKRRGVGKYFLSVFCSLLTFFYMALTGFSYSVVRAGIMLIVYFLSLLFRRKNDSLTTLFTAAFFITAENPYSVFDIGFELSFFATFGILSFASPMMSLISKHDVFSQKLPTDKFKRFAMSTSRKISLDIIMTILNTVSATVVTIPICLLYFKEIALFSLFANLSIIFAIDLLLIATTLFAVVSRSNILPLKVFAGNICVILSDITEKSAQTLAQLLPDPVRFSPEETTVLAICIVAVIIMFSLFFKKPYSILPLTVMIFVVAISVCTITEKNNSEKIFITFSTSDTCRDTIVEKGNTVTLLSDMRSTSTYSSLSQMLIKRNIYKIDCAVFFTDGTVETEKIDKILQRCDIKEIVIITTGKTIYPAEKRTLKNKFENIRFVQQNSFEPNSFIKIKKLNGTYFSFTISSENNDTVFLFCIDKNVRLPQNLCKDAEGVVIFGKCNSLPKAVHSEFYYAEKSDDNRSEISNIDDIKFGFITLCAQNIKYTFYD